MTASVLLVEDDHDFATSLVIALGLIDIDVVRAESAERALELFAPEAQRFRLVFCDIKLPGLDGISCLEKLRALKPDLVGVVMTGFRDEALFERARNAGAVDILLKPFKMSSFMALAKKYIES
ncbi:MAG: response regulator [Desulfuromonadales bacterium]|nr:response regulator [Desulfuromonadales bacterium]